MAEATPRSRLAIGNGIGGVLALASVVIVVVAALVYGAARWIDSDNGRGFLVKQLPRIELEIGLTFSADRIDGSIFGTATIHGLKLSDPKGVFAEIDRVDLDWRPFDLAKKTFTARRLTTPEFRLLRLPRLLPSTSPTFFPDFNFAIARFRIDRLVLEAPVTGRRRVFGIGGNADIRTGRARVDLTALTRGETASGRGDSLRLHLDVEPDADKFDVDAMVAAPAGGALVTLLGLPAPLDARLSGDGSWSKWTGKLAARLGGKPLADVAITGNSGRFTANGSAAPAGIVPGVPAALLAPALTIDASADFDNGAAAVAAAFTSAAIDVRLRGGIDTAAESFDDFVVNARLLRPAAVSAALSGRDIAVTARLAGTLRRPIVDYRLTAASLGWGATVVSELRAAGIVNLAAAPLTIPLAASASRITGLNASVTPFLTNVRIDGAFTLANGQVTTNGLRFRSDRLSGTINLVATPGNSTFLISTKTAVPRVAIPGIGIADVDIDLRISSGPGGQQLSGPVRIRVTRLDNAALASLTQGLPIIVADVVVAPDRSVVIRSLRLTAPGLSATGSGRYGADGRIAATATGVSRGYGPFRLAVTGPAAAPVIEVTLARPGLGIGLADLTARIRGGADGWRFDANAQTRYGPLTAAGIVGTRAPIVVDVGRLTLAGLTGQGRVVQTPAGPFAGTIDIAGRGLAAKLVLSAQDAVQRADITASATAAQINLATPVTIDKGTLSLTVLLPRGTGPIVKGRFEVSDVQRGDLAIDASSGTIDFANANGRATFVASGSADIPFAVKADLDFDPGRVTVAASGSVDRRPITLSAPAVISRTAAGWALAPVTIVTPEGKMLLEGLFGDQVRVKAVLDRVSLALLTVAFPRFDVSGRVSGSIDLTLADSGVPLGSANLRINGLSRATVTSVSAPIDIGINAAFDAGAATARAVIVRGSTIEGRAQARIGPIPAGPEPLVERIFAARVFGQLRFQGPAEIIWGLTGIGGVDIRGPIAIAADVGGVLGNPQLTGTARSEGARVEVTALGSVIDQASLDARFTQSRLELVRFGGRVGRNGSITGTGGIDLVRARGFPIDVRLAMKDAQFVNRDELTATATGNIRIATDEYGGVISGKLQVNEARYRLGRTAAAQVAVLPVTEINTRVLRRRVNSYVPPTRWLVSMDIAADRQLFVSGMGLESEWRAGLKVRGPVTAPEIVGRVEVVRGDYDFAGKRFTLTRGDLRFQGTSPPDPTINVSATSTSNGFTAQLDITGTATRPAIAFSSVPSLPEDEILSRILFGESVTNLSAPEAVQLAAALGSLRGGGGFNPINAVRSGLGIDRLRIMPADAATGRGTSVAAGQYIGRNVYVELATDAQGYTATRIEVSLTRSLSILSEVATLGGTSAGVRWKRDY